QERTIDDGPDRVHHEIGARSPREHFQRRAGAIHCEIAACLQIQREAVADALVERAPGGLQLVDVHDGVLSALCMSCLIRCFSRLSFVETFVSLMPRMPAMSL